MGSGVTVALLFLVKLIEISYVAPVNDAALAAAGRNNAKLADSRAPEHGPDRMPRRGFHSGIATVICSPPTERQRCLSLTAAARASCASHNGPVISSLEFGRLPT